MQAEPRIGSTDWETAGGAGIVHSVAAENTDSGVGRDTDGEETVDTH